MHAANLNGQTIAYRYRPGGGPVVVFANSLGSDQTLWDGVIDRLGGGFGTLTYDLRGHGLSAPSERVSIGKLADDLIALVTHLGLRDVFLCGVSVGGMVAQAVCAKRPDLVAGAILSNTGPQIGSADKWNDRIARVQAGGLDAIADTILGSWFEPGYGAGNPAAMQMHRAMLSRTSAQGYTAICAAIRDADLSDATRAITVPTLCIAGSADQSTPPALVRAMANLIPGAKFTELPKVGHLPALEAPDQMAAWIEAFVPAPTGDTTRRAVLGDAHVDRAVAAQTPMDAPFQDLITQGAWGTVWSSPGISHRDRSMLTLALLAATGNFDEIPMHVRATTRTGATLRDLQETFQHVAIYAGVPRANHALKLAKQVLAEDGTRDD